jgi:beta-N-acetylhexosaminidase
MYKRHMMKNTVPENTQAVIVSCSGTVLTEDERTLFGEWKPFGFILFGRNVEDKAQLKKLCSDLRESVGWNCPILIDQEGGRVRRMRPPVWDEYPAMKEIGDAHDKALLIRTINGIANDLLEVGIDVDCVPVLDVLFEDTHAAIGTRAFSMDPNVVSDMGGLVIETCIANGITPVIKHLPGQGRSSLDSHYDLPVVAASLEDLQAVDFLPFRHVLNGPDAKHIWGMVSHIIYEAIDSEHPASVSPKIVEIIRKDIGFTGLLLSDDLCMDALKRYGNPADRVVKTLEAGMDIALYCAGKLEDMTEIARHSIPLRDDSMGRYERSKIATT